MWNRQDLKKSGKVKFRYNYWVSVAAAAVMTLSFSQGSSTLRNLHLSDSRTVSLVGSIGIVGILIRVFVWNPFRVGGARYFLENAHHEGNGRQLLYGFKSNYLNIVYVLFVTDLMIGLLSLLLVVPGIVAAYKWRFVPYILAEYPDMKSATVRSSSAIMMDGNKLDALVLDLSFILWHLLSLLTLGILDFLYVSPYQQATNTELYLALKDKVIITDQPIINAY